MSLIKKTTIGIILFGAGCFVGWLIPDPYFRIPQLIRERHDYQFINPLIGFDVPEEIGLQRDSQLREQLARTIKKYRDEKRIDTASIYVRRMNTGRWISLNGEEQFSPASMLKVTVMTSYFKAAENNPGLLESRTLFSGIQDKNISSFYKPSQTLQQGKSYSVMELIEHMIKYSDNTAHFMLINNDLFPQGNLAQLDADLGIDVRNHESAADFMTANTYSTFFRILYNATYLSRSMSERALEILSETDFRDGLVAHLPSDLTVAHKFGERSVPTEEGTLRRELHDCGIIYYPDHPYFLCVMTKGKEFSSMASFIAEVSKTVYDYFENENF